MDFTNKVHSKALLQDTLEHTLLQKLHPCKICKIRIDVLLYKIHLDEHYLV